MASARLRADDDPVAAAELLIAEGRSAEAAARLKRLLEGGRGGLLSRMALVKALIASGENAEAIAVARESALLNPQAALAAQMLGEALLSAEKLAAAIAEFQRALRLDPRLPDARLGLGRAWLAAGEAENALRALEAMADDEASPAQSEAIAEARAMLASSRSDARYVRHLFDEFSANYDARMLGQLSYGAPRILRDLAGMLGMAKPSAYAILDLGCGTGLAGEAFKPLASKLHGVDLSPAMIEKARARNIYDTLRVADLETALAEESARFDLILAADTLVYIGDLSSLFAAASRRLAADGVFLFTVEKADAPSFELGPKRRWRHSQSYLRTEAHRAGLDVTGLLACHPRTEAGVPVEGLAVALKVDMAGKVG